MKSNRNIGSAPSSRETISGFCYLVVQLLVLPSLLRWFNGQLSRPLNAGELNFVYYLINFMACLLIFRNFLGRSADQVTQHPAYFCQAVILGLAAYYASSWAMEHIVRLLMPGFSNYNNQEIAAMSRGNYLLMFVGTVILVPPVEECLFRGLIFRNLYGTSHWAAYGMSIIGFAMVHILGYIGRYSPLELVIAVLQYLPAGLSLAWAYAKGNTIFAPIVIHAVINYLTIRNVR